MRQRRLFGILTGSVLPSTFLFFLVGCGPKGTDTKQQAAPGAKVVLVSFPPLYSFAKSVAGDDAQVNVLLTGTGPHAQPDPTADQLKLAKNADLFFIIGLGFDENISEKIQQAGGKSKAELVELGEKIDQKTLREGGHHHHHHDGKEEKEDKKGEKEEEGHDPHIWLSPRHAKMVVAVIRDELKEHDAAHAAGYDSRANAYMDRLDQLHKDGNVLLKDKKERTIVTFHDSLGYFADSFGLTIAGVVQVDAGHEPSAQHIKDLIKICKEKNVRVIAVEPQFNSNHADTVLRELRKVPELKDAQTVVIDPLETAADNEISADLYEKRMRTNLQELARVLK
jgi:ABC-type Zn uptake system ZnuABC Zn-binding protein ZnuA